MKKNGNAGTVIKQVQQTVDNYKWTAQINILPMGVATPLSVDTMTLRRDGEQPGGWPVMSSGPQGNCRRAMLAQHYWARFMDL